jgi:hypothetical protein
MMKHLIILSVVACSTYYILAYSRILAWLRPWLPRFLQSLLTCSACSGFWLGAIGGLVLQPWQGEGLTMGNVLGKGLVVPGPLLSALWCCTTTPILFKVMLTSLDFLAADLQAANAAEDDSNAPQEE